MTSLILFALLATAVSAFRYDGYQVFEVGPFIDAGQAKYVADLADDDERIRQVILLNEHVLVSKPIHLAVSPDAVSFVTSLLDEKQIMFTVVNDNLQRSFDESMQKNNEERSQWLKSGNLRAPTTYLRYDEQVSWINGVVSASPIASTFSIGQTHENRNTIGVAINGGNSNLPAIWIDSNIHAREWITSASTLYIIDQILNGNTADAIDMRTNYRWYIVPNANPDGYEYTWDSDRLWRKNREPNTGSICTGTDLNRNWGENWGGEGSSGAACSETYRGSAAFSAVETQNMRDYMQTIAADCNVMISIHCYSQYWLVPWGGTNNKPADYNELMRVGNLAADAIRSVNGLSFLVGTPPDILYVAAGGSFDYTKAQLGMQYSYSPELRPASGASNGFDIPSSNITPSGAETFAAVVATVQNAQHKI